MKLKNAALLCLVSIGLALGGCDHPQQTGSGSAARNLPAVDVTVEQVTARNAGIQVELVGTVQSVDRAEISAKISGNIVALPVDLGSRVKQGDLLVELSAGEISAQVQQARAQLDQARRNLQREENLLKKNAATPESVKSLREAERIAEAAYKEALTMLDYSRITAPFAGIVTRKFVSVGDLATPGKPLLILEEGSNLQVLTDIPEAMLGKVAEGDRLNVEIPAVDVHTEGVVAEVSPTADPDSRTAPVKLNLKPDPRLRSGQFARVKLNTPGSSTLVVPSGAVVPYGQMERVFVVEDGRAGLHLVLTGARDGDNVEILSGLSEGETVIVSGNETLVDGQPVNIHK